MKTTIYMALVFAVALAACEKEKPCPVPSDPVAVFHQQLIGSYEQVGFKTALFPEWSYTDNGPMVTISSDSITGTDPASYQVLNAGTIFLQPQNQLVHVTFGDTVVFAYQNGDSLKLIRQ